MGKVMEGCGGVTEKGVYAYQLEHVSIGYGRMTSIYHDQEL